MLRCLIVLAAISLGLSTDVNSVASTPGVIDDFNDGVWDADKKWDAENYLMGGRVPDKLTFDEATRSGVLTIRSAEDGDAQATLIAREDLQLAPGEWIKVDVAIMANEPRIPVRVGLGIASSLGRKHDMGEAARENSICWGLSTKGQVRAHVYGAEGKEIGGIETGLSDFKLGRFYTLAIRRLNEKVYEFYAAPAGQPLELCGGAQSFSGASGSSEQPPQIPGIFTDPGLGSYVVLIDDFEVGRDWPVQPSEARLDAALTEAIQLPQDPHSLHLGLPADIFTLPILKSTRHVVHMPKGDNDFTYHHSAEVTWFEGKFYLAWTVTPKNEHTLPYQGWVSTSPDGETWSEPINIAAPGDAAYLEYMRKRFNIPGDEEVVVNLAPRSWHIHDGKLYLWSLGWTSRANGRDWVIRVFRTETGTEWHEIPAAELDRLEKEEGLVIRETGSNRGFARIHGDRLLAATNGPTRADGLNLCAPITSDLTGLSGWEGGWIDTHLADNIGEPNCWEGRDGALHFLVRSTGVHVWHSYSLDSGKTWSRLEAQPGFTDNPSNKNFGRLADGTIWYVGDPVPLEKRVPLVLGLSRDGWKFDRCFLVRPEPIEQRWPDPKKTERPGYEYPTALYHDGFLYVAYSHARDFIEVSKINLADIPLEE